MTEKEIAEIRRRFRADKGNVIKLRGCYVNDKKEIISEFKQSTGTMSMEEFEALLTIIKKTLSGTLGKNLMDIEFSTKQVLDSDEHKLLMAIRDSSLDDDNAVQEFYKRIIETIKMDGNYLILLSYDKYDVPSYSKDDFKQDSSEVFSYFLCSICPVKLTKPVLSYHTFENRFQNLASDLYVSSPELGFMFPAFDDRSANIYNAVYYSRNISEIHSDFINTVFNTESPMPAAVQKEIFQSILSDTIADDCSLDVVQAVHEQFAEMIEEHKTNKESEPPTVTKETVVHVLESCGVSKDRVTAFEEKYDTEFGENLQISPRNIIDVKQFEVRTPNVTIRVNPEHSDLIETRIIDGAKYILIRANDGVEVNGVNINI
jgi:hypothetical protein